jgi:CubicO group peptidase (beta-lactamase class C family)
MFATRLGMGALLFGALITAIPGRSDAAAPGADVRCATLPPAVGGPSNAHTRFVEKNLYPAVIQPDAGPSTLFDRMRTYEVPGISVAVIHHGKLDWARGWGVRDAASCAPVTQDTAFQAASISKLVTAVLALRMVEQGKLDLDGNINRVLHSWQLPVDPKLAPDGVTLRQLLSHTAGLSTHGFAGYLPDAPLPSTVQILEGQAPANNEKVRSILPVGGQWVYSGGGYVLVQLALSDASGVPFAALAQHELLDPLGMTRSAFAQPPSPAIRSNMAFAHAQGRPIAGNYHVYPELAPAGLWASPTDLARLLIDVQASAGGGSGHRLSPAMTREMLTPVKGVWGLGAALYPDGIPRFGHDGLNEGFESLMIAYSGKGEGIVAMTNGGAGRRLINEVVRAVATDYGWKEVAAPAAPEQALPATYLQTLAGTYQGGDLTVLLEARPDGLYAYIGQPNPERLRATSPTRFQVESIDVVIEFNADRSSFDIVEGPALRFVRSAMPLPDARNAPSAAER